MLERGGLLPATSAPFDFVSRQARMPSAYTFRRTRLPVSKAKALAQESRALREQVASDSAPPWTEAEPRPTLPLTSTHVTSGELPEVAAFATAQSYNLSLIHI